MMLHFSPLPTACGVHSLQPLEVCDFPSSLNIFLWVCILGAPVFYTVEFRYCPVVGTARKSPLPVVIALQCSPSFYPFSTRAKGGSLPHAREKQDV